MTIICNKTTNEQIGKNRLLSDLFAVLKLMNAKRIRLNDETLEFISNSLVLSVEVILSIYIYIHIYVCIHSFTNTYIHTYIHLYRRHARRGI